MTTDYAIWSAFHVKENRTYLALFHLADQPLDFSFSTTPYDVSVDGMYLHDLWNGSLKKQIGDVLSVDLPIHGCIIYEILTEDAASSLSVS